MIPSKQTTELSDAARRFIRNSRDAGYSNQVSDADLPVAREIAEAHLGRLYYSNYGHSLTLVPRAKHFAVADGVSDFTMQHGLYAEVAILSAHARDGFLLAALKGARFDRVDRNRDLPWAQWRLVVRHPTAVDCDHSASTLADIAIDNPQPTRLDAQGSVLVGTLTGIRIYPTGTDITLMDDQSPERLLAEPKMCTYGSCADKPHPFGPYLPPEREEFDAYLGQPVQITLRPLNSVDDHGLPLGESSITDTRVAD